MNTYRIVPVILAVALGACRTEEEAPPTELTPSIGHFVATTVEGLSYVSGDLTGTTKADGGYTYFPGEPIEFSVGKVSLGGGPAVPRMTMLDLAMGLDAQDGAMVNRAKFLQSLDEDGNRSNGIKIGPKVVELVNRALDDLDIKDIDFADDAQVNQVVFRVFVWLSVEGANNLDLVESAEAQQSLKKMLLDENAYSARLSRDAELDSARPNLIIAHNLVAPTPGSNVLSTRQLVATWSEEVAHAGARDAYASISIDDGQTWTNYNLSQSALKSSYSTKGGRDFPGDTGPVSAVVADDHFLAAWSSRYCPRENPLDLKDDKYGATGPQGAPAVANASEAPFACVWAIRGQIQSDGLHLRFPEQLTSGVRDASQVRVAGAHDVGFTVAWTEDPEGNHVFPAPGTDVWKTELPWDTFLVTAGPYEKLPVVRFDAPVRVTDNAACRYEALNWPGENATVKRDWWALHQTEGEAYCNDVCVALGEGGYCVTEDGNTLSGTAAATDLQLAMARQPALAKMADPGWMGNNLFAWEERRGSRLEGSDVRFHSMATRAPDAVVGGSAVNRPERIAMNPRLATQDSSTLVGGGTRFVIAYQMMDALYPANNALMMRSAREGYGAEALGQAVAIADGSGRAQLGSLALAGENVAVAYSSGISGGTRNAYVRVSSNGGSSFELGGLNMSQLGDGTVDALEPSVVWSSGPNPMLFATFATRDGNLPGDLFYGRSADLGATFDTVPLIDPETGAETEVFDHLAHGWPAETEARVVVAPDGENLYAVWLQEARHQSDIWFRPIAY